MITTLESGVLTLSINQSINQGIFRVAQVALPLQGPLQV